MNLNFIAVFVICLIAQPFVYCSSITIQDAIQSEIEATTAQITEKDIVNADDLAIFDLYNERGICYFFKETYVHALEDFDRILQRSYTHSGLDDALVGAALWGRTLCQAHLGLEKETQENIRLLREFFIENKKWKCKDKEATLSRSKLQEYKYRPQTLAKFANPNENISRRECRERVIGTADAMKALISTVRRGEISWLLTQFIDELEMVGIDCCRDGTFWATCVTPLIDRLSEWKIFGIPADPAWDD